MIQGGDCSRKKGKNNQPALMMSMVAMMSTMVTRSKWQGG